MEQKSQQTGQQATNAALAALAAAGNSFALGQLWTINEDFIRRKAWQWYNKNKDTADRLALTFEDLVQEVFISVWEGKRTFSDIKELTNYLYRACYNNTLLYIRNNQIHDSILSSLAEECRQDEDMIYALTVKEEIIRQLYFHIEELPPEQRRIILLRIEGYTWEEIAERLEISINTVKTQKSRSYKFLREKLGDSIHSIILCLFF